MNSPRQGELREVRRELLRDVVRDLVDASVPLDTAHVWVMRRVSSAMLDRRFGARADAIRRRARLFSERWAAPSEGHLPATLHDRFHTLARALDGGDEHELGWLYETLISAGSAPGKLRKRSGSFYTPPELARTVVRRALERRPPAARLPVVCDPALGAGAFLLEAAALLAEPGSPVSRRRVVEHCLYGVDQNELAIAVAEIGLWLFAGDPELDAARLAAHLRHADALELDWQAAFPEVFADDAGFDLVLGNPPWVAFAGRAAQRLEPEERARYARFRSFRGYPTLHALFVERSAELCPRGSVALLLPSPVSDLDGYRAARAALTRTHVPREPLLEFGQDAFQAVTQPCFALIADADAAATPSERSWRLVERQRAHAEARTVEAPAELFRLFEREPLPAESFGEMGFQTSRIASQTLLLRAEAPDDRHRYPLLQGRDVQEFREGQPRLFLNDDPERLRAAGCRLRPLEAYRKVDFVVRQTASFPIAARHAGLPFRNTLLAGFARDDLDAELLVGLLNSTLYRALHLAARRDARQAVFPQVKIRHLRSLPRPPRGHALLPQIAALAERAAAEGGGPDLRAALDDSVFEVFGLSQSESARVRHFVGERLRPRSADS